MIKIYFSPSSEGSVTLNEENLNCDKCNTPLEESMLVRADWGFIKDLKYYCKYCINKIPMKSQLCETRLVHIVDKIPKDAQLIHFRKPDMQSTKSVIDVALDQNDGAKVLNNCKYAKIADTREIIEEPEEIKLIEGDKQ